MRLRSRSRPHLPTMISRHGSRAPTPCHTKFTK
jgi:hypothetical protein